MQSFVASVIGFQNNEIYAYNRFNDLEQAKRFLESKKPCEYEIRQYFVELVNGNAKTIVVNYCL